MFSKKSWRSLKFEKFFHHADFFLIALTIQEPICFLYWDSEISQNQGFEQKFFGLCLPTKTTILQTDNIMLVDFFFLSFRENVSWRPFIFSGWRQFLRYSGFTRCLSDLWRGNAFKFLSCNRNFPNFMVVKTFEFQYN